MFHCFLIKHPQLSDCKQVNKVTQQSFIEFKFHPVCPLLRRQKNIHTLNTNLSRHILLKFSTQ